MSEMRFVLVLMLVFSGNLFAGPNEELQTSSESLKSAHSIKIRAVKNDVSLTITFYKASKEIGAWPFHDNDGGRWLKEKTKITGMTTVYSDKGSVIGKGLYVDSMKQGKWLEYSLSGKLHGEYIYKDGSRNGPYKEYYVTGSLAEEGVFLSGDEYVHMKGHFKTFYPSGKLKSECAGVENKGEGIFQEKECKKYSQNERWMESLSGLDYTP